MTDHNPSAVDDIERINPPSLIDSSPWGFSQIVVAPANSRVVFLSGQFSGNVDGDVVGRTVGEQMPIAFRNLAHAIEAAGAKPEHVAKIQVLIVDHEEAFLPQLVEETVNLFGEHHPASTLIPVPRLALDAMKFEIEATLAVPR